MRWGPRVSLQIAQVMLMLLVAGHPLGSKDLEKDDRMGEGRMEAGGLVDGSHNLYRP